MFIKKFDLLSPSITLYYNEEYQHSSIFSGFLSIITYIIVCIIAVYYILNFIERKQPKAYFFNRFIEDAGTFPVNASSMFNFIQIADSASNEAIPFDFESFRVVGFDNVQSEQYMNEPNITEKVNHWIYGFCNNDTDTEGISNLIDFKYFEQSACIRKYYDKDKKTYYNTDEEGFRWPIIEKGCSHPNRTFYGIIIQRCDKAPEFLKKQGPSCKEEEEINDFIESISLKFQLMNHYADMLNYEKPFLKSFSEISSGIIDDIFITNHLNFNPAKMLTHNGYFIENEEKQDSYIYTQNEKHTIDQSSLEQNKSTNGCIIAIYFWMQNILQHYERNYDKVQDVLSDIGGINSIVVTFAYAINLIVNNYIILIDTAKFVSYTNEDNFNKSDSRRKPSIFRKANEIMYPPKKSYSIQRNLSSFNEEIIPSDNQNNKKEEVKSLKIYDIKDEKYKPYKTENIEGNIIYNNYRNNSNFQKKRKKFYLKEISHYFKKNNNDKKKMSDSNIHITLGGKNDKNAYKKKFDFFKYLSYLICLGKNNPTITYYEEFRAKLISEENIIQSYLDLYKILKMHNIQKKSLFSKPITLN